MKNHANYNSVTSHLDVKPLNEATKGFVRKSTTSIKGGCHDNNPSFSVMSESLLKVPVSQFVILDPSILLDARLLWDSMGPCFEFDLVHGNEHYKRVARVICSVAGVI